MGVYWLPIYQGAAPASPTSVFTGSASRYGRAAVKAINITNNAYTPVQVWVWCLPSGVTDTADAYLIVPGWVLPAADLSRGGSSRQWTGFQVIMEGDQILVSGTPGGQAAVQIMGGYQK